MWGVDLWSNTNSVNHALILIAFHEINFSGFIAVSMGIRLWMISGIKVMQLLIPCTDYGCRLDIPDMVTVGSAIWSGCL